ncbi:MAG: HypC/HybG/HupF family hydrogenase formation chaperone [Candidatus Nanopelagicales bacterium]
MCLGVPGRIEQVWQSAGTRMATVDFGGVRKEVCLACVPDLAVGDYTIVHVGFAIARLDESAALETLRLFQAIGLLDEELADKRSVQSVPTSEPSASTADSAGDPW